MKAETIEIILARADNLPMSRSIASKLTRRIDARDFTSSEAEIYCELDIALFVKVLRLANSKRVKNSSFIYRPKDAVRQLGIDGVRKVFYDLCYRNNEGENYEEKPYFSRSNLWQHSLAVAVAAREISKKRNPHLSEAFFYAGMIHDVGYLVYELLFPDIFERILKHSRGALLPFADSEASEGFWDHAQLGALVRRSWGVPEVIARAIEFHHQPSFDTKMYETSCILSTANQLAYKAGFTNSQDYLDMQIDDVALWELDLGIPQMAEIEEKMVAYVLAAESNWMRLSA